MVAFHGNYDKLNRTFYVIISDYYPVFQGRPIIREDWGQVCSWFTLSEGFINPQGTPSNLHAMVAILVPHLNMSQE
jgi:hypothetical protein